MEEVYAALDGESILPKLASQLSRHLVFPLIEFEAGRAEEKGDDDKARKILAGKIKLLEDTNMADYVAQLYQDLNGGSEPPAEYTKKRNEVIAQLEKYEADTAKISELLTREDVVGALRSDKVANLEFLKKDHDVTIEMVNALYEFGQFQFRCGNYGAAAELLYQFRVLSTDNDRVSSATWGKLASEILTTNWDASVEEILKVKEGIDSKLYNNPRAQLDHRTMLVHWALFPLFNHDGAREAVLDLFFSAAYINTIQTSCPWVLRYLIAAVITGRSRSRNSSLHQKQMKDVIRYVRQEAYEYSDPITEFVSALYVAHDFNAAREALRKAEEVCRADFFLMSSSDAFVDAARHLICESYCKIFSRMNIRDLSAKLGLNPDDGEKWIVNLIRETRLDAKIDSQEGTVIMNHPPNNVYQQVIEKTKGGFFRTQVLTAAVSKS
ncbi:Eukaryotic translation initiation factor 3 subunit E [Colletotrichum fructicola]|uniref:Eukaryotic translation initiation factor 3 subunit E n=5 Tax=Colletotrichum gloeosporioides species complex TaxID=2707338 RepID=L2GDW1_COLFN|nr:Eukaryotic translation initiation factor 3 subunit E [Colletotrichum fructicola]XP_036493090.1 Eukaryotic translation initiation factor 3 subunit E [Colletotrichum siamense]XP_045257759.1 Eukaryotic translation initiation factor 3 subunit E [Colletotrichum gloeosporioides]XP_053032495.1 eukaryotic translation initiation factor 3 subunit E [Colletotrichum chrysophilum]KAF0317873.1 eukaryotic translation initiation factor 3 subunit [Colletotrichum asianum]KAF4477312.1 Eukaryotic translation i